MKKRTLTLLLALALCLPAAAAEYDRIYDETDALGSSALADLGEVYLPAACEQMTFDLRVDVLTDHVHDSLYDAAAYIYMLYDYGLGETNRGASLTLLVEQDAYGDWVLALAQQYGCGVYAALVGDYTQSGCSSVTDAARQLYEDGGLGVGGGQDGLLLLLSLNERDYALYCSGETAEYAFGDYAREQLSGAFLGDLGKDDWAGGIESYITACGTMLEQAANGEPVTESPVTDYVLGISGRELTLSERVEAERVQVDYAGLMGCLGMDETGLLYGCILFGPDGGEVSGTLSMLPQWDGMLVRPAGGEQLIDAPEGLEFRPAA